MKEYLFNDHELKIIKHLKSLTPEKIWWNYFEYVFDYGEYHIKLEIQCAEKLIVDDLTNDSIIHTEKGEYNIFEQYVMNTKLSKADSQFIHNAGSELLCSNERIEEIKIVRTLLYFCKHKRLKDHLNHFNCDSYIINPNLKLDDNKRIERTYLADIGLLLIFKDKQINSFILENDDDFGRNSQYQMDNLFEIMKELYEFIDI